MTPLPKKENPGWLYYTVDFPMYRAIERFIEIFGAAPEKVEGKKLLGGTVVRLGPITDKVWNSRKGYQL